MELWVVYEANTIAPRVFKTREDAEAYRQKRLRMIYNRHQVYMAPVTLGDE